MENFNSAARLHKIINEVLTIKDDKLQAKSVWAKCFSYDANNLLEASEHAVEFHGLVQRVLYDVEEVLTLNDDLDSIHMYVEDVKPLKNLVAGFIHTSQWANYKKFLHPGTTRSLQFCSKELSRAGFEENHLQNDFEKLIEKLDSLFEFVFYSDLPRHVRLSIVESITFIKRSIKFYSINGYFGIETAASSLFGGILKNRGSVSNCNKAREIVDVSGGVFQELERIGQKAGSFANALENCLSLIERLVEK